MNQRNLHYETVWSPIIRTWHWLLVVSVVSGWLLGEFRTFSVMQWHIYMGYTTGMLLLLRILIGFWGTGPVTFRAILSSTTQLKSYLPGILLREPSGAKGHNPLGAISVIVILLLLTAQVLTGLFAEDDALFFEGPLVALISDSIVRKMTYFHHLGARAVLIIVTIHISAILFYLIWKKENLISAMMTGRKLVVKRTEG